MTRFLRYSLENNKKIRAMFMRDGIVTQENILVTAFDEDCFSFITTKKKGIQTLPLHMLLSLGYARGDKTD